MIQVQTLRNGLLALTAALLALPFVPTQTEAQDGARFRVLVANLTPTDGTRDRFGERTANELRDILDLARHVAMPGRDIDNAARDFDLRLGDLNCITARQLAAQLRVPLVFCGEYHTEDGLIHFSGQFVTVPDGDEFEVAPHALREGDTREAANYILQSFERTADRLNQIQFCGVEYSVQNWDQALEYCTRAVELTPDATEARYLLARTLMEREEFNESLGQFEVLLAEDPNSSRYLENAGWVAAQVGDAEQAHQYYSRFLRNNPDNVNVRMRLAYDLAQTGDFRGAVDLLREGFDRAPDDLELHERFGAYAFRAALDIQQGGPDIRPAADADDPLDSATEAAPADGVDVPNAAATAVEGSEVAELFRSAIHSLERVLEARGSETLPQYVINSMRAYLQLDEPEEAIAFGERAIQYFQENPQVLSQLADAYNRAGRVQGAIERLEAALEINPELPNARARMGNMLLQAGEPDLAVEWILRAEEAGEQPSDVLAGMLLGHGFNQGTQQNNFDLGLRMFDAVRQLDISTEFRSQVDFFQGYTLYQQANQAQAPQTLQSAQASLPMFEQVLEYMEGADDYAQRQGQTDALESVRQAARQHIDVQSAIIQRESRR